MRRPALVGYRYGSRRQGRSAYGDPGFGKGRTDKFVIWREIKEEAFVPNTASIVDPHELQRIDRRLATRRTRLMKELVEGRTGDYVKERDSIWARLSG